LAIAFNSQVRQDAIVEPTPGSFRLAGSVAICEPLEPVELLCNALTAAPFKEVKRES